MLLRPHELEHVPLQLLLQLSAQCLSHLPWQVLKHEFMQRLLQPEQEVEDDSAALAINGILANATAPRMGSTPLAAALKKLRRDWSSSFFSFITLTVPIGSPDSDWGK